ncbi:taurine ABC transporter permease [Leucobacter sp. UCD-THU]|uniref:ABC transporter permease n=1 Tax=Leucobacter sp. UCD-THU TaxID=1292023 RepID=UPI000381C974|nr:ABC transporter permease [Leucobacter sp. UCD-THU]EYT54581.1 taurine ABC transporter permease [Leucobacter sp. UCD-THU]
MAQLAAEPAVGSHHGFRLRAGLSKAAWFASPFVLLLAIWLIAIPVLDVSPRVFPSFAQVLGALGEMIGDGTLWLHMGVSILRVIVGAGLAVLVGIPFGILMGMNRAVSGFFSPLLRFSVALAGIAWIPLATLWLGYGDPAVIFVVFNAVFFAIVYNTMLGVQQIPTNLIRAARSLGASPLRMFFQIYLPGAAPAIATGTRIGMGFAWRGLIAAEIIATAAGLGYSLFLARQYYETDVIILMMIVIGVLWLLMDRLLLAPLERRTVERWGARAGVE